jgi:hypothetical protein
MARTWEMSALVASIEFFADGSRYSGGQLRSILHLPMSARWPADTNGSVSQYLQLGSTEGEQA